MGDKTGIQWTDATWNPTRGCRRISPGCENCYAERQANRMSSGAYKGLVTLGKQGPRWTGNGRLVPDLLDQPLRWTKPRLIFVDSMSDLFYEGFSNEEIAAVFGVMAASPKHTFQVLTKRAQRMRAWFEWVNSARFAADACLNAAVSSGVDFAELHFPSTRSQATMPWPLPNVWLGVSVEDQAHADERIPELLRTPAAVRFVSYEPALGPVDFTPWLSQKFDHCPDETDDESTDECRGCPAIPNDGNNSGDVCSAVYTPRLDWIIVGGESGPKARPFDVAWARSVVEQCKASGVACFVKQLGARPGWKCDGCDADPPNGDRWCDGHPLLLKNKKGADPSEWPSDLRMREHPR